jgi:hypothetical protein
LVTDRASHEHLQIRIHHTPCPAGDDDLATIWVKAWLSAATPNPMIIKGNALFHRLPAPPTTRNGFIRGRRALVATLSFERCGLTNTAI